MKKQYTKHLILVFLTAIVVKSSILSINLAEALLGLGILALTGVTSFLDDAKQKEIAKEQDNSAKIYADIKILEDRLKSVEAKSSMSSLAKTQAPIKSSGSKRFR